MVSTDMLVEDVHFRSSSPPKEIGQRAAGANLSDLAAMGAEPTCLLLSLGVPQGFDDVGAITEGVTSYGVPLVGGDLSSSPVLVLSVTAVGRTERPVLRSTARAGDVLAVTGVLGAQAARNYREPITPRVREGQALAPFVNAMMDISDGIATDAGRLAAASGLAAEIEVSRLPTAPGVTPETAATAGEDYELLVALPAEALAHSPVPLTVVGRLSPGSGLRILDGAGNAVQLGGFDHFVDRSPATGSHR